ncbi:putative nucleotidyltransferase substrate binding domain-containing protein [Microbacterium sp.]|uniref:putative nucleotidyltransferase substrate binding domain-containing protein n=1 Tax=Microbacterium sp. TaxID=51671 RepID=UPI003C760931
MWANPATSFPTRRRPAIEARTIAETTESTAALAGAPPFDLLPKETIADLAAASQIAEYATGDVVLDAFKNTPRVVCVVLAGVVELSVDADRAHDPADTPGPDMRIGVGEVFGLDAGLTGKAIGPLAVAAGPARVLRVPADRVETALTVAGVLRPVTLPLVLVDEFSRSAHQLTVDELVEATPLMVPATSSVRDVAAAMTTRGGAGFAALALPDGGLGIVTDRTLRERVLARGLSLDTPAAEATVTDLPRVTCGASAAEALILLLDRDAEYVLVMSRDQRLFGVIDPRDFIDSAVTAGMRLHEQIRRARTVDDLQVRAQRMPALLADLLDGGLASSRVLTVYSALVDAVIRRMLTLVFERHRPLTLDAFTWLSLGSNGRREATLSSDVDSAAAFHGKISQKEIDAYRAVFYEVTGCLAAAGLTTDQYGATAAHKLFSRTSAAWKASARAWLADPLRDNAAMMASLMVDARPIHGDPGLPDVNRAFTRLRRHPATMRLLLEESLAQRARLRSLRDVLAGRADRFDVKHYALQPITNLARWAALSVGSSALPTADRLRAAAGSSMLPERQAAALIEVFEVLQGIRLRHQLWQVEAGQRPTDDLDLARLSVIDRSIITRAVREIATVQKRMANLSRFTEIDDWNRRESDGRVR